MQQTSALQASIVSSLCFLYAFVVSQILDRLAGPLDPSKPRTRLFIEATLQIAAAGALIYLSSYFVDYVVGHRGTEIPVMVFIFFFFQKNFQKKVNYIINHTP